MAPAIQVAGLTKFYGGETGTKALDDVTLAIGDISGHDQMAAAAMGQVRNLLRGLAYDSVDGPARVLSRLDAALRGLQLDTLATALLATPRS